MPTTFDIPNCDVTIMGRIIEPERGDLSLAAARAFQKFAFTESDQERMHVLLERARAGTLTDVEDNEIDDYERVGHLIDMMHSKARKTLKTHANGRR